MMRQAITIKMIVFFLVSVISKSGFYKNKDNKFGLKVANVSDCFQTYFITVALVNKLNRGKLWAI